MNSLLISPFFANALSFAFEKATVEGKLTIGLLVIVSLFSWTVMINKGRQLLRARSAGRKFFAAYRATREPMEIFNKNDEFPGAPAYEVYFAGAEELAYHLKNNPVEVVRVKKAVGGSPTASHAETDMLARSMVTKISNPSYESVKVSLERAVSVQARSEEHTSELQSR